jgi:hypothetical protein
MKEDTWYSRNRERALEAARCYYEENKPTILVRQKERRKNKRAEVAAYDRRYYRAHAKKRVSQSRAWCLSHGYKSTVAVKVHNAVKAGILIKPEECSRCNGHYYLIAHHEDYSRPLNVDWLCQSCHKEVHKNKKGGGALANNASGKRIRA